MKTKEGQQRIESIGNQLIADANKLIKRRNEAALNKFWDDLEYEDIPVGWVSTAILDTAASAGVLVPSHLEWCAGYARDYRNGRAKPDNQLLLAKRLGRLPKRLIGCF